LARDGKGQERETLMTSSFVNPDHEQTLIGRALNTAVRTTKVTDKFQEPLYLVLELLRAGVCHGDRWGGADTEVLSGGPSFGTGKCLLVSVCLTPRDARTR
jgi:hypothetical protein